MGLNAQEQIALGAGALLAGNDKVRFSVNTLDTAQNWTVILEITQ